MEGSAEYKKTAAIIINRIFSLIYFMAALVVSYGAINGDTDLFGSIALAGFSSFQAVGNYQPHLWGAKVTAAVFGAINFGMIFYLLPGYEPDLVPNLESRLMNFVAFTIVTTLLVMDYILCNRLFGQVTIKKQTQLDK